MFWKSRKKIEAAELEHERETRERIAIGRQLNEAAKKAAEDYKPNVARIGLFAGIEDVGARLSEIEEVKSSPAVNEIEEDKLFLALSSYGVDGICDVVEVHYKSGRVRSIKVPLHTAEKVAAEILKAVNGGGK